MQYGPGIGTGLTGGVGATAVLMNDLHQGLFAVAIGVVLAGGAMCVRRFRRTRPDQRQ